MTREEKEKLRNSIKDFADRMRDLPGFHYSFDLNDIDFLCAELKNSWEREAVMEKALKQSAKFGGDFGENYWSALADEALAKVSRMRGESI